jgi:uncharacterized protein (DUF2141 family)
MCLVAIALGGRAPAGRTLSSDTQTATASVSGHVFVDGPAKQPARRVRVTLTDPSRIFPGQTTTTDDSGSFEFTNLPAGRFEVQAFKTGYLRGSYGAARPERAGTPIVIKNGETVANLAVTIARGGVISGVVRDVQGRPVPGVSVRVLRFGFNAITGERTLGAPSGGSSATSDDRGEYRAYGLPPGSYLVLATPGPLTRSGPSDSHDDIRVLTSAELQQAMRAARAGGAGGSTPNAGAASGSAGPAPPAAPVRLNYAPVFHPGVTDIGAANTIALGLSEERNGADITIRFVTTATITGTITDPSGVLPQRLQVALVPAGAQTELLAGAGLRGSSTTPRPDGTYTFTGVAPGTYTVKASTFPAGGGRALTTPTGEPAKWAAADVAVNGRDIDVPLSLQRGVTINGRVVFEGSGAKPSAADLQTLMFRLVPPASGGQLLSTTGGRVDADGRFTFADIVPDVYQFITQWPSPTAGSTWTIKASVANGRDAFDAPLVVSANASLDWTVTYTDTPAVLSGVLVDRTGRAATDYYILVFPTDRRYWSAGAGFRRIRTARPATDGAFTAKGLPPGEYFVSALTDLESGEWNDPSFLEQLLSSSVKVTLREGETTRQDLRIGG